MKNINFFFCVQFQIKQREQKPEASMKNENEKEEKKRRTSCLEKVCVMYCGFDRETRKANRSKSKRLLAHVY